MVKPYRDPRDEYTAPEHTEPRPRVDFRHTYRFARSDELRRRDGRFVPLHPEVSRKRVGILRRLADWFGSLLRPRTTAPCLLLAAPRSREAAQLDELMERHNALIADMEEAERRVSEARLAVMRADQLAAPWARDVPMPEPPTTYEEMAKGARYERPPPTAMPVPGPPERRRG